MCFTCISTGDRPSCQGRLYGEMGTPEVKRLKQLEDALVTFVAFALAVAIVLHGSEALGLDFMKEPPQGVDARWGANAYP